MNVKESIIPFKNLARLRFESCTEFAARQSRALASGVAAAASATRRCRAWPSGAVLSASAHLLVAQWLVAGAFRRDSQE